MSGLEKAQTDQLGGLTENDRDDIVVATLLALLGIENIDGLSPSGTFFAIDPATTMRVFRTVLASGHDAVLFSPDFLEALRTVCCFAPGFIHKLQVGTAAVSDPVVTAFLLNVGRFWIPELPRQTTESLLLHSLPGRLWPNAQHLFFASWAYLLGHEVSHAENGDTYADASSSLLMETRADRDGLDMFSRYIDRNAAALEPILKHVCVAPYLVLCLLALMSDPDRAGKRHPSLSDRLRMLNEQIGVSLRSALGPRFGATLGASAVAEIVLVGTALVECFSAFRKELDDLAVKAMRHEKPFPRLYEVEGLAPGTLLRLGIDNAQLAALPAGQRAVLETMIEQYAAAEEAEATAHRAG